MKKLLLLILLVSSMLAPAQEEIGFIGGYYEQYKGAATFDNEKFLAQYTHKQQFSSRGIIQLDIINNTFSVIWNNGDRWVADITGKDYKGDKVTKFTGKWRKSFYMGQLVVIDAGTSGCITKVNSRIVEDDRFDFEVWQKVYTFYGGCLVEQSQETKDELAALKAKQDTENKEQARRSKIRSETYWLKDLVSKEVYSEHFQEQMNSSWENIIDYLPSFFVLRHRENKSVVFIEDFYMGNVYYRRNGRIWEMDFEYSKECRVDDFKRKETEWFGKNPPYRYIKCPKHALSRGGTVPGLDGFEKEGVEIYPMLKLDTIHFRIEKGITTIRVKKDTVVFKSDTPKKELTRKLIIEKYTGTETGKQTIQYSAGMIGREESWFTVCKSDPLTYLHQNY